MIEVVINDGNPESGFLLFGIMVFLITWFVFVPVAITSRLERIIKLLEEKQ